MADTISDIILNSEAYVDVYTESGIVIINPIEIITDEEVIEEVE